MQASRSRSQADVFPLMLNVYDAGRMPVRHTRTYLAVAGGLAWAGVLVQLAVSIGTMDVGGLSLPEILWRLTGYFTILTNIVVATSYTARVVAPASALGRFFARTAVDSAVLAAITLVGAVYVLILQRLWEPKGAQLLADVLLHYVTPLGYIGYWVFLQPRGALQWRFVPLWLLYPCGYLAYAIARGALDGWYAYPFINVAAIGYGRTFANALGLIVIFSIVGLLIVALDKVLARFLVPVEELRVG